MMASDRPASLPPPEPVEAPPTETPPIALAAPKPTHGTIKPWPFLNGFDLVLATGVILLGFAIASFAVKNSDFWLHVGTGRLLAQGEYEFGKAPFTYSGTDRHWTNHAWLYDLVTYKIFNGMSGRAVVIAKGIAIALLVLLLLQIRKPRQSLWFGVLGVSLALLASAPWLLMQPSLISFVFLGITLFILLQVPFRAKSWKAPAAIGVTFWFWANCDQWFFLGPVTVALFLLGEFLQRRFRREPASGTDVKMLATALGLGIVTCMLNPNHVHVWRVPAELGSGSLAATLGKDPDLALMFRSILDKGALDFDGSSGGNPVNAIAFALLSLLTVVGFVLNLRRFSWGLLLVSTALFALAIFHAAAIPFCAIAAAATIALNFGEFASRLREKTFTVGTLQMFSAGRVGIRVVLLLVGLTALIACYPGWLHPFGEHRRLVWEVEPDPAIVKTAQAMRKWRDDGKLPDDARSLILNIDLAHYCAWYAPTEKTYFDSRLGFHENEAETYVKLRSVFLRKPDSPKVDFNASEFLNENKIAFVAFGSSDRIENTVSFRSLLRAGPRQPWTLWYIGGRFVALGWRGLQPGQFIALRFDPVGQACGPDVKKIADPVALLTPINRGFVDKFVFDPPSKPDDAEESTLLNEYYSIQEDAGQLLYIRRRNAFLLGYGGIGSLLSLPIPSIHGSPPLRATALLAVRAARRAILASPDHPDGYLALAQAYNNSDFPVPRVEMRNVLVVCSLERFFERATPDHLKARQTEAFRAAMDLVQLHSPRSDRGDLVQGVIHRRDLSLEALRRGLSILKLAPVGTAENWQQMIKNFEAEIKKREENFHQAENFWLTNAGSGPSGYRRAESALGMGLCRKAIDEFEKVRQNEGGRLPLEQQVNAVFSLIGLYLFTGQVEKAESQLRELEEKYGDELSHHEATRSAAHSLRLQTDLIAGRFADAIQIQSQIGSEKQEPLRKRATNDVAVASALAIARQMSYPPASVLREIEPICKNMLVSDLQLLRQQPRPDERFFFLSREFRGNPLFFPYFDAVVWRNYFEQLGNQEELIFQLGMIYLEQGDVEGAALQFREVRKWLPADVVTDVRILAQLYISMIKRP